MRIKRLAEWARNLVYLTRPKKGLHTLTSAPDPDAPPVPKIPKATVDAALVKALLPRAWFTKKGPGIGDRTWRAFNAFSDEQKLLAVDKGWIPKGWLPARLQTEDNET